ncbi:MAG TPA: secondary thiamine-phosphate synthase enzyme YjbQ [Candidatus Nanopelagicaceae bacterium]|nr:secondary thiamine-phosphate synthase enzyme YjbQ [Candidatus Nanopelagicaceae bacterium]
MIIFEEFNVKTPEREVLLEITNEIKKVVKNSNINEGTCRIFVPHTTAGITINENADQSVMKDVANYLNRLIPKGGGLGYSFKHGEGNSDAHIKCSLTGNSIYVLIHEGKLMLGTWQGIIFTEYDGPRNRKVFIQITGEP